MVESPLKDQIEKSTSDWIIMIISLSPQRVRHDILHFQDIKVSNSCENRIQELFLHASRPPQPVTSVVDSSFSSAGNRCKKNDHNTS